MTKKELIVRIQKIYEELDDLDSLILELKNTERKIRLLIEEILEESEEIIEGKEDE